jgi:hypothetical protein
MCKQLISLCDEMCNSFHTNIVEAPMKMWPGGTKSVYFYFFDTTQDHTTNSLNLDKSVGPSHVLLI